MSSRFIINIITLDSLLARITSGISAFLLEIHIETQTEDYQMAKRPLGNSLGKCSYLIKLQEERRQLQDFRAIPLATLGTPYVKSSISR